MVGVPAPKANRLSIYVHSVPYDSQSPPPVVHRTALLTIFSVPRPFRGGARILQTNAVTSWTLLRPRPRIILFGKEEGSEELAEKLGIECYEVQRNDHGTPYVSDAFKRALELASTGIYSFVSADVILMSDFMRAVRTFALWTQGPSLMVSRRWNATIDDFLDFGGGWEKELEELVRRTGWLEQPEVIDLFTFTGSMKLEMPPFLVGRGGWENWMIYRARQLRAPIVDCWPTVIPVHQHHLFWEPSFGDRITKFDEYEAMQRLVRKIAPSVSLFTTEESVYEVGYRGIEPSYRRRAPIRDALNGTGPLPALYPKVFRIAFPITRQLGRVARLARMALTSMSPPPLWERAGSKDHVVYNLRHHDNDNIGDRYCVPIRYCQDLFDPQVTLVDAAIRHPDVRYLKGQVVVLGGGGIFHPWVYNRLVEPLLRRGNHVIAWGVGHHHDDDPHNKYARPQAAAWERSLETYRADYPLDRFALAGIRDDVGYGRFVPCPTCLHDAFDTRFEAQHPVVLYEQGVRAPIQITGAPRMPNVGPRSIHEVLEFLGSGETVITNSFHGVYWALLLGRRVLVYEPWSTKFFTFRPHLVQCTRFDWQEKLEIATTWPGGLEESRKLNRAFAKDVAGTIRAILAK